MLSLRCLLAEEAARCVSFEPVRNWLHKTGGNYKSEKIAINAPNGTVLMKLDWSKAKTIKRKDKIFIDFPY